MNYQQTLDFLYSQLPIFQRQGAQAYNKDLTRTIALCKALNNPQEKLKFIHVAGTNGKGSVCHTLASIFKEAGHSTGLYTSPHLLDFRERIQLNGAYITKEFVCDFIARIKDAIETIKPSFFELTVAMAFEYFAAKKADIVLLETGMGGRLDSTNVITPELSIITNIGMDHMAYLGNTLKAIAVEKAGIIKPGRPVLTGNAAPETTALFEEKAKELGSPFSTSSDVNIEVTDDNWKITFKNGISYSVRPKLKATYQKENLKLVSAAYQLLADEWHITPEHLILGIENIDKNYPLLGRWQRICQEPSIILDVGHNADGIVSVLNELSKELYNDLHIVFGMVNDKDLKLLELLPKDACYHLTQPNIPRALPVETLQQEIENNHLHIVSTSQSVLTSMDLALEKSHKTDLILVMGSLFVVAEALEYFNKKNLNTSIK